MITSQRLKQLQEQYKNSLPSIALLMILHDRLEYTIKSVLQVLRIELPFDFIIIDNASTDNTKKFLANIQKDPRVKIEYLTKHQPLSVITNKFWRGHVNYDLIGKIDNDTLIGQSWFKRVAQVFQYNTSIAAVGGFAFDIYTDWNFEVSKKNVREIGPNCKILVQPIIGGCAYLTRPQVIEEVGFLEEDIRIEKVKALDGSTKVAISSEKWTQELGVFKPDSPRAIIHGWTEWQKRAQEKGYVVCYPFPLEIVEHMDDPLNPHCLLDKDLSVTELAKKNAKQRGMEYSKKTINDWIRRDGKYLFTQYEYKGFIGKKVY